MFGERFKQKSKEAEVIADLDAIMVEPVAFKLHGVNHIVPPISVAQAFKLSNSIHQFNELMKKEKLTPDEVIDGYYEMIKTAAPSVTKEDVMKADERQLASLFSFIVRAFTGELFAEKKKTMTEQNKSQSSSLH